MNPFVQSHPPIMRRPASLVGCLLAIVFALSLPVAAQNADLARLWKNPVFKKKLLGSYGINSEIEPPASPEEMSDYEKIVNLIPTDPKEAERLIKLILESKEDATALFDFTLGNIYFQDGRSREAAQAYIGAIRKFPSFRRAHQNLAIIYIQNGYQEPAIRHFTEAIELGGADSTLFGLLGSAYMIDEQPVAAEGAFRNALLLAPDVNDWKLGLARSLLSQGRYVDVVALTNTMIAEKPDDLTLWRLQATAYIGAKDLNNAAANYEILDQIDELEAAELNTLGDIYLSNNMFGLAADSYLRAYRRQPSVTDLEAPLRAAELLAARNVRDEASDLLAEVQSQAGATLDEEQELRILRLRANILMAGDGRDEAAEILETVVEQDPLDGESLISLGRYHVGKGEVEKAEFYFERAANLEDFTADANVRLAQLLVGKKEYNRAIPLLKRAQELEPRDSVADYLEDLERFIKVRR